MNTTSKEFKTFEPQLDERAFLYQQVQELAEQGLEFGGMSVSCEKIDKSEAEPEKYAVNLLLSPGEMNLESRGEGESLIEAAVKAKEAMAKSLELIAGHLNGQERMAKIQFITEGHQLH